MKRKKSETASLRKRMERLQKRREAISREIHDIQRELKIARVREIAAIEPPAEPPCEHCLGVGLVNLLGKPLAFGSKFKECPDCRGTGVVR